MAAFCRDLQQFGDIARSIWPRLSIYKGDTHWRFLTEGKSDGESFYLDLEGMFSPVIPVEQALNLAAWIVCLVDPGLERFNRLVKEIKKS